MPSIPRRPRGPPPPLDPEGVLTLTLRDNEYLAYAAVTDEKGTVLAEEAFFPEEAGERTVPPGRALPLASRPSQANRALGPIRAARMSRVDFPAQASAAA